MTEEVEKNYFKFLNKNEREKWVKQNDFVFYLFLVFITKFIQLIGAFLAHRLK